MAFPIEEKLVVAVASSALFDLEESDRVFQERGKEEYRKFQRQHLDDTLKKGVAFPFIRRLLNLNSVYIEEQPVEVILLSRNDPDTGQRVFRSIKHYGLNISRAGFLSGKSPFRYIPAFNASLFLSANAQDVQNAVKANYPAGTVLDTKIVDDENDMELRIAFDFDGVLADDEAEAVYKKTKDIHKYHDSETEKADIPLNPGPLNDLFRKLSRFQALESEKAAKDRNYNRALRTAIITARNAPADDRFVTTLRNWGVTVDETFFLGGIDKSRILSVMQPHIYFDDQLSHLDSAGRNIPSVHVPFGIANEVNGKGSDVST